MTGNERMFVSLHATPSALALLVALTGFGCGGSPATSLQMSPTATAGSSPSAVVSNKTTGVGTSAGSSAVAMGGAVSGQGGSVNTPGTAAGAGGASGPTMSSAANGVTYHKDIRPLIESSCLDCHVAGGIGPFPLDNWNAVKSVSAQVVGAVTSGIMPPSRWNNDCQPLYEDRSLPQAKRDLFAKWKDNAFAEGVQSDYVAPPPRTKKELGQPTIVMTNKAPYTPPAMADEYRCFVLDTIQKETYLTGMEIIPGVNEEVHHVILYRVTASALAQAQQQDQQDSKPGYLCNGGAGVASQNMFSQRPGSEAVTFGKGDAAFMEAGSTMIIQVHYNTVFLAAGHQPTPDATKVALWTLPEGQVPEHVIYRTTTFGPVNLPAGEAHLVSNISQPMSQLSTLSSGSPLGGPGGFPMTGAGGFPMTGTGTGSGFLPGEVIGMTPHAHQLATQMHASLKRADGTTVCLDDVKWDFHWQLDYIFAKGVPYTSGDQFVADCIFDNSAANQPVIDGQKQQPKNVQFGERSTDEMCEHYIWLRFERAAFLKARGLM